MHVLIYGTSKIFNKNGYYSNKIVAKCGSNILKRTIMLTTYIVVVGSSCGNGLMVGDIGLTCSFVVAVLSKWWYSSVVERHGVVMR